MHSAHKKRTRRILLRIVLPLAIILAGSILAIRYGASIWLNTMRAEIEQAVSDATGTQARVRGTVSASLWPTPGIALGDIELTRQGRKVLTAGEFTTSFELKPLFDRQLIIHAVDIDKLSLVLDATEGGLPLVPVLPGPVDTAPAQSRFRLSIPERIELRNSDISVLSPDGTVLHSVKGLNLAVRPSRYGYSWSQVRSLLKDNVADPDSWIATIHLNFEQAGIRQLKLGRSEFVAHYRPGHIAVGITSARVFDGDATGTVSWIVTQDQPRVSATLVLNDFESSQSVTLFQPNSIINGKLDLAANLAGDASSAGNFIRSASGTVKLSGANLDVKTLNVDELVTRIINSKQYNLADAAAYFFIGPLGATATKGLNVANVARELMQPGTTPNRIRRMTSAWNVADGYASARDVALETERYRLALTGKINLVSNEFNKVEIAVVDDNGCAIAVQRIDGPVASPRIDKTNILLTLTRPVLDALTKSAMRLVSGNCQAFYSGELLPEKKNPAANGSDGVYGDDGAQKGVAAEEAG